MAKLARDAGFPTSRSCRPTASPASSPRSTPARSTTVGLYFMYDVKQFDPAEWTSPPLEGRLVDKPGARQVCIGPRRGQPEGAAKSPSSPRCTPFKAAGSKLPVNLVLVCEGEEEIGSPHFAQIVRKPEVLAALKKCVGVFMPAASAGAATAASRSTSARRASSSCELVSSGEKWGRGPAKDVHSSLKAQVDSPAWHLVAGARHAGRDRRQHAGHRRLLREGAGRSPPRRRQMIARARAADRNEAARQASSSASSTGSTT